MRCGTEEGVLLLSVALDVLETPWIFLASHYFMPILKFHPFCKISNHHYHRDENDLFLVFESVQYFTEEVWASKIERNHISQYPVLSFLPFLILPSFYCSSSFPFCFLESSIFISLHNKEQHGPSSWVSCPSYNPTHQNQYL